MLLLRQRFSGSYEYPKTLTLVDVRGIEPLTS